MNEVSTAAAKQRSNCSQQKLTIGLDLGDRTVAAGRACPAQWPVHPKPRFARLLPSPAAIAVGCLCFSVSSDSFHFVLKLSWYRTIEKVRETALRQFSRSGVCPFHVISPTGGRTPSICLGIISWRTSWHSPSAN